MSTFLIIAFPMLCVGLVLCVLAKKTKIRNFLVPGYVMLACGVANAVIGLSTGV